MRKQRVLGPSPGRLTNLRTPLRGTVAKTVAGTCRIWENRASARRRPLRNPLAQIEGWGAMCAMGVRVTHLPRAQDFQGNFPSVLSRLVESPIRTQLI